MGSELDAETNVWPAIAEHFKPLVEQFLRDRKDYSVGADGEREELSWPVKERGAIAVSELVKAGGTQAGGLVIKKEPPSTLLQKVSVYS